MTYNHNLSQKMPGSLDDEKIEQEEEEGKENMLRSVINSQSTARTPSRTSNSFFVQ